MIKVSELVVCSDCGTVYHPKYSEGYCPKCNIDLRVPISETSD